MGTQILERVALARFAAVHSGQACLRCGTAHVTYVRGAITFADCLGVARIIAFKPWSMR